MRSLRKRQYLHCDNEDPNFPLRILYVRGAGAVKPLPLKLAFNFCMQFAANG